MARDRGRMCICVFTSLVLGLLSAGAALAGSCECFSVLGSATRQTPGSIDLLSRALGSDHAHTRWYAAVVLENLGGQASSSTPALTRALEDESSRVRGQAQSALETIRAATEETPD